MHSKPSAPAVTFVTLGLAGFLFAGPVAWAQKTPSGPVCTSSAWTGTVTYSRTQHLSDSRTVERVSGRGQDSRHFELNYNYRAVVAVLESPARDGSNVGRATVNHTMTSQETSVARESNSCDRGKSWQEMTGTFTTEQVTTGQGQDVANVTIGVRDDGTYTVGVAAPRIKGLSSGSQKSSFSGQCTAKEGKNLDYPRSETSIDGGSLTSNGTHRVNPEEPTRLSGTYFEAHQGIRETITWNLERCGAPLRVTDVTFEDMRFPTWNAWREITEQTGTVDGNYVRIKATVFNGSAERRSGEVRFIETYQGDKWNSGYPDRPLTQPAVSVTLAPGEAKDVEILWDSQGYAWFDDGRPRLVQRVRAELWENSKRVDQLTRNLKITPKPVVLVHGPWSGWNIFQTWQNLFTTTHSYDWKAYSVGEQAEKGKLDYSPQAFEADSPPVAQTAATLKSYIRHAQVERNAWHVDVVAHSGGGVVARYYISRMMPEPYPDMRPQITQLVMLGTPNMGTPCANQFISAAEAAGRDPGFLRQLSTDSMEAFNREHADPRGVKFSALAGDSLLPWSCYSVGANDGMVPVASAHWTVADRGRSKSGHLDLTSTKDFSEFVKPRLAIGPGGKPIPVGPAK